MIINNILNKLYFHPVNYGLIILAVLAGIFKEFLLVALLIIVHELGHLLAALFFDWNIDKIYLYPFGGCVKFRESLNKPLKEELIIMLMGPIFQIIFYIVIVLLYKNNLVNYNTYLIIKNYHYSLLFFNLLPAIPLDGGRLLHILLNYLYPYKKSLKISGIVAYIVFFLTIIFILFKYHNFNLLLLTILLIFKVILEQRNIDFIFNKFILDRYLSKYSFLGFKIINNQNNMYKDKKHVIKSNKRYISEREYLLKRYSNKN